MNLKVITCYIIKFVKLFHIFHCCRQFLTSKVFLKAINSHHVKEPFSARPKIKLAINANYIAIESLHTSTSSCFKNLTLFSFLLRCLVRRSLMMSWPTSPNSFCRVMQPPPIIFCNDVACFCNRASSSTSAAGTRRCRSTEKQTKIFEKNNENKSIATKRFLFGCSGYRCSCENQSPPAKFTSHKCRFEYSHTHKREQFIRDIWSKIGS